MKVRSTRLSVETLGDRIVPSTVAYGDFNSDGLMDKAAITASRTITVSLANPDGSYTVSARITVKKPITSVAVTDWNGDGKLDILASSSSGISFAPGKGDGTFKKPIFMGNGW